MNKETGLRYYGHVSAIDPAGLKRLRIKRELSQETLAERAKVSVRAVQKAEQGKNIDRENAAAIADALGETLEKLFRVEGGEIARGDRGDPHPETKDARWMNFLATLPWQEPYHVTDCAWVYRFPGVGVDAIELTYDSERQSPRYDRIMPESALAAVNSWHDPNPQREAKIRKEPWGLQVRLERVEFSHPRRQHVFTLAPAKFLYYVAIQQRLWSDPALRDLRNGAFDNGLPTGSALILPSQFAIHMGVITREGAVLLRQRREDTPLYASAWEAGIGEFMHGPKYSGDFPHFVRGKPSLAKLLKNAVAEELGYKGARPNDFAIYGFAIEHQTLAPKLLVIYTSDVDIEVLCEGGKRKKSKKGQDVKTVAPDWSPDVRSIKLNPQEIAMALKRFPDWGPTSRLTLMLALRHNADSPEEHLALVEEVKNLMS